MPASLALPSPAGDGASPQALPKSPSDSPPASAPVSPSGLGRTQALAAFVVLVLWLILFAGGMLIDTKPYRYSISPGGVTALEMGTAEGAAAMPYMPSTPAPGLVISWIVVLLWFLPVNLALVCAAAGVLGAFGNRANLHHDRADRPPADDSNPYVSAMLRGFFVYLFLISGLLLLDDAPFSSSTPGQYVRLAGFLSLFSFVVNYSPHIFSGLVTWAFHRMQVRSGEEGTLPAGTREVHYARAETVEVARITDGPDVPAPAAERASDVRDARG